MFPKSRDGQLSPLQFECSVVVTSSTAKGSPGENVPTAAERARAARQVLHLQTSPLLSGSKSSDSWAASLGLYSNLCCLAVV